MPAKAPRDVMLFPPTEREATLEEVRVELAAAMAKLCAATREAEECIGGRAGECAACPMHATPHINDVLVRIARKKVKKHA
jgi:hypothetical protein